MIRAVVLLTGLAGLGLSAGAMAPAQVERAVILNPLSEATRVDPVPFEGVVDEVAEAGPYAYLRLGDRWVVGLDKGVVAGDAVVVTPVGIKTDYVSRRTGRTFATLWFGVVRPSEG